MVRRFVPAAIVLALAAVFSTVAVTDAGAAPGDNGAANSQSYHAVCGPTTHGRARCHSWLQDKLPTKKTTTTTRATSSSTTATSTSTSSTSTSTTSTSTSTSTTSTSTTTPNTSCTPVAPVPSGYGACDLQAAYSLPAATAGAGKVVAIVDAYDDPSAESDLGVYRAKYGLPRAPRRTGASAR